jgi:hypothetical protein
MRKMQLESIEIDTCGKMLRIKDALWFRESRFCRQEKHERAFSAGRIVDYTDVNRREWRTGQVYRRWDVEHTVIEK